MLGVDLSQQALQLPHAFPCSGAGHNLLVAPNIGWSLLMTVDVHGQKVTGPWLIICELILIIKLGGMMSGSRNFRN